MSFPPPSCSVCIKTNLGFTSSLWFRTADTLCFAPGDNLWQCAEISSTEQQLLEVAERHTISDHITQVDACVLMATMYEKMAQVKDGEVRLKTCTVPSAPSHLKERNNQHHFERCRCRCRGMLRHQ